MKEPESIQLNQQEVNELEARIKSSTLSAGDQKIILRLIQFSLWLQFRLSEAKLTMRKLRSLFGFKTEKFKPPKNDTDSDNDNNHDTDSNNDNHSGDPPNTGTGSDDKPPPKKRKGGHNAYANYHGLPEQFIAHPTHQAGDRCDCGGRLYHVKPAGFIQLTGQLPIGGCRYQLERLRCGTCGEVHTAPLPAAIAARGRYTPSLNASLAVSRCHLGVPSYRLAQCALSQGIPLPVATQWACMEKVASPLIPLFCHFLWLIAIRPWLLKDDTPKTVLSLMAENKQPNYKGPKGMRTTALVSPGQKGDQADIYLYLTGRNHAGHNSDKILALRPTPLKRQYHMSDGLSHNSPKRYTVEEFNCLAHARRPFIHGLSQAHEDSEHVLALIGKVYWHDKICEEKALNEVQRLYFHRRYSKPILSRLHRCLTKWQAEKRYEPASQMGKAITYILKRWRALTRFLHVPGAMLDNSAAEQAIKYVVRHRKNSLFYKTGYGALVGDVLLSVVTTAFRCGVPLINYLVALQENSEAVLRRPQEWTPWAFKARLPTANASLAPD